MASARRPRLPLSTVLAQLAEATADVKPKPPPTPIDTKSSDLAALYSFGANLDAVLGDVGGQEWLSAKGAAQSTKLLQESSGGKTHLFTLATDGAGNFTCLDLKSGKIVDWDHETRRVSAVAPSLAEHLAETVLPEVRRLRAEAKAIAGEKAKGTSQPGSMPEAPKKLTPVPSALITKYDSASYSGGARSLAFVGDNEVLMGLQNSSRLLELGGETKDVRPGGLVAYHASSGLLLLVGGGVGLVHAKTQRTLALFQVEGGGSSVRFSPDGSLACITAWDGPVTLWDIAKRKGIPKVVKPPFTPSYELPTGKPLATLTGLGSFVRASVFSPDGAKLAVGDGAGKFCIWDVRTRRLENAVKRSGGAIMAIDFARDGESVFVGFDSGVERISLKGKVLGGWKRAGGLHDLRVLSDRVVATIGPRELALLDVDRGKALATLPRKVRGWAGIEDVRGDRLLLKGPAGIVRVS